MTVADLNADGKQDVIVANAGYYNHVGVQVLMNRTKPGTGNPDFAAPQFFPAAGSGSRTVIATDVNGDGKLDLVDVGDALFVLLNTTPAGSKDPTFAAYQATDSGNRSDIGLIGDLNGDGKPDMVGIFNYNYGSPGTFGVFLNASNARFTGQTYTIDGTPPQLTLPPDQIFKAPTALGAVVHFIGATATDDYTAHPDISYSPAQDSFFSLGTTVVTATATDAVGNQSSGTFKITVQYTPPTASIGGLPAGNTIPDNTAAVLTASAVHPLNPNGADVFSYNWTACENGTMFATGTGPTFAFVPYDNGTVGISVTATDSDGATSAPATATLTVVNASPVVSIGYDLLPVDTSNTPTAPSGLLIGYSASASDSLADMQQGFGYAWSVKLGGSTYALPAGTVTNAPSFTFAPTSAGSYAITVVVTDKDGGATSSTQALAVTSMDVNSLQNVLTVRANAANQYFFSSPSPVGVTVQADPSQLSAVISALNGLVQPNVYGYNWDAGDYENVQVPLIVAVNLTNNNYQDVVLSLQPGVTVILNGVNGSTIVGNSPALTVNSGNVIVNNVTLKTATDSPTILVAGGNLTLRNDVVQESTGYNDAAISVTNGSVDLGTTDNPGNNTINVNGSGSPVQSTGTGVVTAAGDTFQNNGTTFNPVSSLTLTSSVNPAFFTQSITLTATIAVGSTQKSSPTGTVTFYDLTRGVTLGSSKVSKGIAQWTGSTLAPGGHAIRAVYSGDANFISSSADIVENVSNFSGFLAPLSNNLAFNMNRVIPIKWQLGDSNGKIVTGLSAIVSLQVAPVLSGGALGTPFNPTPSNGIGLRNDGKQYTFNWDTKNVPVGTYQIILTLSDGTVQTKTLQIVTKGGYNGLLVDGTVATTTGIGGLLAGDIELYIENSSGLLTSDELARIDDAVAAVDAIIADYGVTITEVTVSASANMVLDTASTSAVGGFADGVLGCTGDGEITLIQGWNWYAGSDGTSIGAGQYDFETVVVHELGHALGLGHSTTAGSVMYPTLDAGAVNRGMATADLNVADNSSGADGLHAGVMDLGRIGNPSYMDAGRIGNPSYGDSREVVFAMLASDRACNPVGGLEGFAAPDVDFANAVAGEKAGPGLAFTAANSGMKHSDLLFAVNLPSADDTPWFDVPRLLDQRLHEQEDAFNSAGSSTDQAESAAEFIAADMSLLDY
jgi:hypothetical protein